MADKLEVTERILYLNACLLERGRWGYDLKEEDFKPLSEIQGIVSLTNDPRPGVENRFTAQVGILGALMTAPDFAEDLWPINIHGLMDMLEGIYEATILMAPKSAKLGPARHYRDDCMVGIIECQLVTTHADDYDADAGREYFQAIVDLVAEEMLVDAAS